MTCDLADNIEISRTGKRIKKLFSETEFLADMHLNLMGFCLVSRISPLKRTKMVIFCFSLAAALAEEFLSPYIFTLTFYLIICRT